MAPKAYFGPELFRFLKQLKKNNNREWFQANKERYEKDLRDPMLRFITDFAAPLRTISRHFRADPRPMGGSLFRIYRDTRFSSDKSPYKTAAAAHFRHEAASDVHAPGFYVHLGPGEVFVAVGLWHPDPETLSRVREAIVKDPAAWKRILSASPFKKTWTFWGESYKRPPAGVDPAHPFIEDLKRKDFVVVASFTEKDACTPGFLERVGEVFRSASPFARFLVKAQKLPY
jgi:uncharacterized protein (TIGR02453 family)